MKGEKFMTIIIILIVALGLGLVLSVGPHVLSFVLSVVGSFERLSWFSLIGTAILAIYWIVFGIRMYQYANAEIVFDENAEPEKLPKFGKKTLIIGIVMTIAWIALFIVTDHSANAAASFSSWRQANSNGLDIAAKIGHLLLAFAGGIFVSLFCRPSRTKKKPTSDSAGASSGNSSK